MPTGAITPLVDKQARLQVRRIALRLTAIIRPSEAELHFAKARHARGLVRTAISRGRWTFPVEIWIRRLSWPKRRLRNAPPYEGSACRTGYGGGVSVTDDELRRAHAIVVDVIARHSDKYMPLFEVLDDELRRREALARRLKNRLYAVESGNLSVRRRKKRIYLSG